MSYAGRKQTNIAKINISKLIAIGNARILSLIKLGLSAADIKTTVTIKVKNKPVAAGIQRIKTYCFHSYELETSFLGLFDSELISKHKDGTRKIDDSKKNSRKSPKIK